MRLIYPGNPDVQYVVAMVMASGSLVGAIVSLFFTTRYRRVDMIRQAPLVTSLSSTSRAPLGLITAGMWCACRYVVRLQVRLDTSLTSH